MADPDLQLSGEGGGGRVGHPDPEIRGGGGLVSSVDNCTNLNRQVRSCLFSFRKQSIASLITQT